VSHCRTAELGSLFVNPIQISLPMRCIQALPADGCA
jgi:hypothetical protein